MPLTVDARSETRNAFVSSEVFLSNVYQLQYPADSNHMFKILSLKLRTRKGEAAALTDYSFDIYLIALQVEIKPLIYSRQFREIVSILHCRSNSRLT